MRHLAAFALVFLTAACSSATPPRTAAASGPERGYYKIGKPYQIKGTTYMPAVDPDYDETGIASWYAGAFTGQPTANGELYDPNQLTAAHRTLPLPSLVRVTNLDNGRVLVVRVNDRGPYARDRIIDLSRRCAQLLGYEQRGTAKVRVQIMAKESQALADAARSGQLATDVASAIETNPQPGVAAPPLQVASAGEIQPVPSIMASPLPVLPGGEQVVDEKAMIKQETGETLRGKDVGGRYLPAPVVHREAVEKTGIYIQAGAFSQMDNANRMKASLAAYNAEVLPVTIEGHTLYRVRVGPVASVPEADAELAQIIQGGAPTARIVVE